VGRLPGTSARNGFPCTRCSRCRCIGHVPAQA
jgi:hypothetical protein